MARETLLPLIDAIYSAASDPTQWPHVACLIQSAIGGHSVNLVLEDSSDNRFTCVYTNGVPKQEIARYQTDIKDNDDLTGLMNTMSEGATFMTQDYYDITALHSLDCYEAFYEDIGYTYCNVGVFHQDGNRRGWISIVRSENDPVYTPDDQLLMQALMPHLRRAFLINAELLEAQLSSALALDALEHIEAATALITPDSRVIKNNHRAEPYIHRSSDASIEHRLRLPDPAANQQLHQLIGVFSKNPHSDENNVITFLDKGAHKIALCFPWQSSQAQMDWLGQDACCIVFILSPSTSSNKPLLLKQTFGLSEAEIRVLQQLMDGRITSEVAESLFISEATVRFHIHNLLRKTNSRNQADLMANVFSMVGVGVE